MFPHVLLKWNTWDDYGYKTTFDATLRISQSDDIDLGRVKILRFDQRFGMTHLPPHPVEQLGPDYCSVGADISYYQKLFSLGQELYGPYLTGISDVAYSEHVRAKFEDLEGYRVSLLRFSGAEGTIADASLLFATSTTLVEKAATEVAFTFKTSLAPDANNLVIDFDFRLRGQLFNRMNVLIGYNGTGKTRLLSNLAIVTSGYGYADKQAAYEKRSGAFIGPPPPFKTVIVVSYSAFDTFIIPGRNAAERERLQEKGDIFGYVYCGLRVRDASHGNEQLDEATTYKLRTPEETEEEFISAVRRLRQANRSAHLLEVLRPLLGDASFLRIGFRDILPLFADNHDTPLRELFRSLSSGHKVVLKILTEMTSHLDGSQPALVLIDEPETHLHPPLLAAFLRSLRICLERLNAYAVVSTHSPVVLQETPSLYVRVLRRIEKQSRIEQPPIETFGENIGTITSEVFNLDDGATDWHNTLRLLTQTLSFSQIEALFERGMSFDMRSYLVSLHAEKEAE